MEKGWIATDGWEPLSLVADNLPTRDWYKITNHIRDRLVRLGYLFC